MKRIGIDEKNNAGKALEYGEAARQTARLAMLEVEGGEEARMEREFTAMVAFADELDGLQGGERQMPQAAIRKCELRKDVPCDSLSAEDALMNAKSTRGRLITVPRAFE